MKILSDGSVEGQTFSGENYKGKYPSPKDGEETYSEYYERVEKCKEKGFHLGDLSWNDWHTYCLGGPGGGGQYVQSYTIGKVPEHAWVSEESNDEDDEY
jgi:hypothetical protein